MAISPMTKVSLILPKDKLDELLLDLQALEGIEICHLAQEDSWRLAFQEDMVHLPEPSQYDIKYDRQLSKRDALDYLSKRKQKLSLAIEQLRTFIPKKGLLQSLKPSKPSLSFADLQKQGSQLDTSNLLREARQDLGLYKELGETIEALTDEIDRLEKWEPLDIKLQELLQFEHVQALVGTVPNTPDDRYRQQLQNLANLESRQIFQNETEYGLVLFLGADIAVRDLEDYYGFVVFDYPYDDLPKERLAILRETREQARRQRQEIEATFKRGTDRLAKLEIQLDYILNMEERELVKNNLAQSQHLLALEGWIEQSALPGLKEKLLAAYGSSILIEEKELSPDQLADAPVKLNNHPLVAPFELVTEMYALPQYYEKDPTPILALFYTVFFGMMVADLGYGLLMVLGTAFAMKWLSLNKGQIRFMRFFNILGFAVSAWGLVYGSFFGFELPLKLISTTKDVTTILILSIAFGFITVFVGLCLGGYQKWRMKERATAYTEGFAWCLILLGVLMAVLGRLLPNLLFLANLGQWLAIANVVGILVVSIKSAKGISGLGTGLFNLYNVSGYVGDLVSFTRLMALGLSGASIGSAFNMIVGLFPPLARFSIGILMFILLHGINIFLSLLSGYVHGARLIFVEFFGKFYEGGGRAFNPLATAGEHVTISRDGRLEEK